MSSFSIRLKELRDSRSFTQSDLAEAVDIPRSTIASWEAGKRTPELGTAQLLADFFGVSLDYLLGRTEQPNSPDQALELESLLKHEMIMFYDEPLDDETKEGIIQFLKLVKQTKEAKKGKKEQ